MATFGASSFFFAPFASAETAEAAPTYKDGFKIEGLMEVTDNPNFAEAEIFGDNVLQDDVREFTDGTLNMKTNALIPEHFAKIFGITPEDDGTFAYPNEDSIPFGGAGYVQVLKRKNEGYLYRAFFYTKVKAMIVGESAKTKEKGFSFEGEKLDMKFFKPLHGKTTYKYRNEFKTIEEAEGWLKTKLNITEAAATSEPDTGSGS